ncbi:MAG: hypothetical protein K5821_15985, partial [Nitrobacter sp.]|uniref:hypothetical protein n=1 Tax=Nitrobacter sp. TaxID=29420 RepID=UPI002632A8E4
SCATKRLGSNPSWRKAGGHVTTMSALSILKDIPVKLNTDQATGFIRQSGDFMQEMGDRRFRPLSSSTPKSARRRRAAGSILLNQSSHGFAKLRR